MLLVDEEPDLQARIREVAGTLDAEYPMNIINLDTRTKSDVVVMTITRPDNSLQAQVKGNWPMCLFYTRQVRYVLFLKDAYFNVMIVAQLACRKVVNSLPKEDIQGQSW